MLYRRLECNRGEFAGDYADHTGHAIDEHHHHLRLRSERCTARGQYAIHGEGRYILELKLDDESQSY